jgi:excisionase family DNA binding protein
LGEFPVFGCLFLGRNMGDIKTKETGETLDVRGASAFLKISRWTLYQLTRRNEIPCHRPIGKKLVFFRSELEEFIRNPKILK